MRFLRFPLVTLASMSLKRPSASDFWASPTVIGDGLSVTRFLRFPLVTLASMSLKRPSASDFWASPTVIGDGLSVTRFLRFPLVTFSPLSLPTLIGVSVFFLDHFGVWSSIELSPSSYGKPLSMILERVLPPSKTSAGGGV